MVRTPSPTSRTTAKEITPIPEIGSRYGKLVVQEITARKVVGNRGVYVICRCDCGNIAEVSSYGLVRSLITRHSRHCGHCGRIQKPFCSHNHDAAKWGRSPSGACRGCNKESSLKCNYGITLEEYERLWQAQDGKCAICGKSLGDLFGRAMAGFFRSGRAEVDHEHVPGKKKPPVRTTVRGLLCGGRWAGCNRKLGRIDSIEWLEKVLMYLKNPPAKIILSSTTKSS